MSKTMTKDDRALAKEAKLSYDRYNNPSGIRPVEYHILVKPKELEQKTAGGIIIPDDPHEREKMGQAEGDLIAVGDVAFHTEGVPWSDAPQVGDRVSFAKYAGIVVKGRDDVDYRLLDDKEVFGVLG